MQDESWRERDIGVGRRAILKHLLTFQLLTEIVIGELWETVNTKRGRGTPDGSKVYKVANKWEKNMPSTGMIDFLTQPVMEVPPNVRGKTDRASKIKYQTTPKNIWTTWHAETAESWDSNESQVSRLVEILAFASSSETARKTVHGQVEGVGVGGSTPK